MITKILLVALVGLSATAQASDLYKWTDDKGVVHYSDYPPPANSAAASRVRVKPGVTSEVDPSPDNAGAGKTTDAAKASPANAETPAPGTPESHTKLCDQARANLNLLQSKYPVADSSGKALSDKTRLELTAQAQQTVTECSKP